MRIKSLPIAVAAVGGIIVAALQIGGNVFNETGRVDRLGLPPVALAAADAPTSAAEKTSAAVVVLARQGGYELVDVLVSYEDLPSADDLGAMQGRMVRNFENLEIAQVRVPAVSLSALGLDNGVASLSLDEPITGAAAMTNKTAKLPNSNSPY